MKEEIISALSITELKSDEIESQLEVPKDASLGDYAFPCFTLSKKLKKSPIEIAKEIAGKINLSEGLEKVQAIGPYVNFFVNRKKLVAETLSTILKEKEKYGSSNLGINKSALIEHTSINPNASPHVGRARNALIGDSITRILRFQGFKVETHYFVNDVGKQIAMLVLASENKTSVNFEELLGMYIDINKRVEQDPSLEDKVFDLLKKFESGDKKVQKKFRDIVSVCIKGQSKIFKELDIHFDSFDYESEYLFNKRTEEILSQLENTGKLKEDEEKRMILDLENYNLSLKSPVLVLTRADKTSLYPLRDIAYSIDKIEKNKEFNFIVLGEDQKTYFKEIESALDILGYSAPKPIHYSFILLTDGKMSTRQGNVVLLEDFMNESLEKASEELQKRYGEVDQSRAKAIAYSAIKYSILKVSSEKNVTFDLDRSLSFEGDTGPYLLYSYARAKSILKKAKYKNGKLNISSINEKEKEFVNKLAKFTEVVSEAYSHLSPNIIANYSYELAQLFNEFYHSNAVIGSKEEEFRLALVKSFTQVLENALKLLGIPVIEEM